MRTWFTATIICLGTAFTTAFGTQEQQAPIAQPVAPVEDSEPACTTHGSSAVPSVEEIRAEAEAKEALVKSLNLCPFAANALLIAAESMSLESLQQYLSQEHHAYDGHSVLEHAAMKVRFALPMAHKPCPECGKTVYHADPDGELAAEEKG